MSYFFFWVQVSHAFVLLLRFLGYASFAAFGLILENKTILPFFSLIFGSEEKHMILLFSYFFFETVVHFWELAMCKFLLGYTLAPDPADL